MNFAADSVVSVFEDEEYVSHAYFSFNRTACPTYLAIARCMQPGGDSDVQLEVGDQANAAEGGIIACRLTPHHLSIILEPGTAKSLRIDGDPLISIEFSIDTEALQALKLTFESIFAKSSCFNFSDALEV